MTVALIGSSRIGAERYASNSEILQPLGMADTTLRPSRGGGELIEVNPEATPLSEFAAQRIRESAAVALLQDC
jgi:hypothetical protein